MAFQWHPITANFWDSLHWVRCRSNLSCLRTITLPLIGHNDAARAVCRWRTHRSPEYFVNFRRFELPVSLESAKRRCYKALSKYSQTRPHMENLQELCIDVYQRHHARKLAAWCGVSPCNALVAACHLLQLCLTMSYYAMLLSVLIIQSVSWHTQAHDRTLHLPELRHAYASKAQRGHVTLAAPFVHIWFVSTSSRNKKRTAGLIGCSTSQ